MITSSTAPAPDVAPRCSGDITPRAGRRLRRSPRSAFTLVEILIGSSIGSMILAGVLSSFLYLSRTGLSVYHYNGMCADARRALEEFSRDARMASDATWNSDASVTLTVPDAYPAHGNLVTYSLQPAGGTFVRRPGGPDSTAPGLVLARQVAGVTFLRFDRLDAPAVTDAATKRLELVLTLRAGGAGAAVVSANAVSASYLLRNKPAT